MKWNATAVTLACVLYNGYISGTFFTDEPHTGYNTNTILSSNLSNYVLIL